MQNIKSKKTALVNLVAFLEGRLTVHSVGLRESWRAVARKIMYVHTTEIKKS